LNPVQFGSEVVDQFGRYLLTTFPIADPDMERQVKEQLRHDVGGERLIAKGPYVYLNRPFEDGPSVGELVSDRSLGLHSALPGVFPFPRVRKHQELALRSVKSGRHTVVATGTGSGKTEAFLLPIVDTCLWLRDKGAEAGVVAILVYPMNALADDQLRRLRPMLAGTGITFGRYTGTTPEEGAPPQGQLPTSRAYSSKEEKALADGHEDQVLLPYEECCSREAIRKRRPRILITNYSQLEYLLLRDKDLDLFRGAPLRFLVMDEVHQYTGALGSEVACLIRRLRAVARKSPDEVVCIGTSATVQDSSGGIDVKGATIKFASRLFGVPVPSIELVVETYKRPPSISAEVYVPAPPDNPDEVLALILDEVRQYRLQESVQDLSEKLVDLAERLCGRKALVAGSCMQRLCGLLKYNRVVLLLGQVLTEPRLLSAVLPRLRPLSREKAHDNDLASEVLAYLTLGALAREDDEPLLRPKLHYFVQGFQGLACAFEEDRRAVVSFDADELRGENDPKLFPMVLCRSCGQHYVALVASEAVLHGTVGVRDTRNAERYDVPGQGDDKVYLTNHLIGRDEAQTAQRDRWTWLCRFCGTMHDQPAPACRNDKCGRRGLVEMFLHEGEMKTCAACGSAAKGYEEIITPAQSSEVADVTILSQTMLSAMSEESLQKLLVFSDNRQDAAFQAGWMDERSRRYRLRHLLYEALTKAPQHVWPLDKLSERIVDAAIERGVFKEKPWNREDDEKRVRWFLLQEFASMGQRRGSVESLGLAEVVVAGLGREMAPEFWSEWTSRFGVDAAGLTALVRLVLDNYRRHGMVSDPLLCHEWTWRDNDVRKGLLQVPEKFYPMALALERTGVGEKGESRIKYVLAGSGMTTAQEIVRKGIPDGGHVASGTRNDFLRQLWQVLLQAGIVVPTALTRKGHGKNEQMTLPAKPYQLNVDRLGVRGAAGHFECAACRRAQSASLPTAACPEYQCQGSLLPARSNPDHYDVYQYTKTRFVPLKAAEHSAQVPGHERREIEEQFKKEIGGKYNCLVCTPTLELGVDIGKLEIALMRNVPPTPANYAQRAGRAGRRHRIAVVFTYCRGSNHDRYFFGDPAGMIAGEIRVPAFSMRNEPLIRKHVHSAILTALREAVTEAERQQLDAVFPSFVHSYFADELYDGGKSHLQYLKSPRETADLRALCSKYRERIVAQVRQTFTQTWPEDEDVAALLGPQAVDGYVDSFAAELARHVHKLFHQVKTYREEASKLRDREEDGQLSEEEEAMLRRYRHAVKALCDPSRMENYALSYLASDGFFPGYAMSRQTVSSTSLEPFLELSRPSAVALREFTPANFVYAHRNVFRVRKLDFSRGAIRDDGSASASGRRTLCFDRGLRRLFDAEGGATEGGKSSDTVRVDSLELVDVEMQRRQEINDSEKQRHRIGFLVHGQPLDQHGGGRHGRVGSLTWKYLTKQRLRLVNLGVQKRGQREHSLFPICQVCGEARSPNASTAELEEKFPEAHRKLHGSPSVEDFALHVEFQSDTLHLGPFDAEGKAANLFESLRIGARLVMDMGTTELEGFLYRSPTGEHWVAMYDPMPGGSGFLPLLLEYWVPICDRARDALDKCATRCGKACYSCMKHFRNQQWHELLDRHAAINLLTELAQPLAAQHDIAPVTIQPATPVEKADSDGEVTFATLCAKHSFPVPPAGSFHVDLGNGEFTVADWAYPEQKVLVFIDGMGEKYHGNPAQKAKDKLKRAKARFLGFHVVEITNDELTDGTSMAGKFQELGMYLDGAQRT